MRKKKALLISMILLVCLACIIGAFAHSGRTDSNGGHRDNNNKSGLGSYHYHCGGYPPHLHTNGVCPYKSKGTSTSSYSSTSDESDDNYSVGYDEAYNEGSEDGYELGYDDGYKEGHRDGYDEGHDDGYDEGYDEGYEDRTEEVAAEREKELIFLLNLIFAIVVIVLLVKFIKRFRKE